MLRRSADSCLHALKCWLWRPIEVLFLCLCPALCLTVGLWKSCLLPSCFCDSQRERERILSNNRSLILSYILQFETTFFLVVGKTMNQLISISQFHTEIRHIMEVQRFESAFWHNNSSVEMVDFWLTKQWNYIGSRLRLHNMCKNTFFIFPVFFLTLLFSIIIIITNVW